MMEDESETWPIQLKLHMAAKEGNIDEVKKLIKEGADVNYRDWQWDSALHTACENGHIDVVNCLLENNADVNLKNFRGYTALHIACRKKDTDIVKYLLENNADIDLGNRFGDTALHIACRKTDTDIVKYLLENNADINLGNALGNTALHSACQNADTDIVKYLLDNNADINLGNEYGKSAEDIAKEKNLMEFLVLKENQQLPDYIPQDEDMVYEPTPETQNFDVDVESKEDLCKIIDAMKRGNSEETYGLISVWDFGGDYIFYTTHQTFLSTRGIYLVVVDITKTLLDEFKDNDCFVDISGLKYLKMGEYIVFWLNSIHTYAGNNQDGVPPVILVATHLDKIQGDKASKMEDLFNKVSKCLEENGTSLIHHLDDDGFGVDNTKSADDPDLERLRQKIFEVAKAQKSWGEEKPASWIAFEKNLIDKQNKGIKMLSFEKVKELSRGLESGVMDHDQLDVFLKFQHAIGNLIYFSDLNEYIVLDPKWLIHAFRCFITDEKFNKKMSFAIRAKWCKFSETAELKREVIDALWNDIDVNHREHLLGLMEKLDIIAKPMTYKGSEDASSNHELDYYFVPPMLKHRIADDQLHFIEKNARITPNMYFVFKNHFISPSVFHRLIAACMKQWKIAHQENMKLYFCGCGIFTTDESQTTRIMICMENYRIKVRVLYYLDQNDSILQNDVLKTIEIRNFVEETLKNIFGKYQQNIPYKLYIECSRGGLIEVDTLKKYPKINCVSHSKDCHLVLSRQLLKYWFNPEEYQNLLATEDGKEKTVNDLPFGFNDRCPSEPQLMEIAEYIGLEFYQLATKLGFETHEIERIKHDHPNDLLGMCFKMLVLWKRRFGRKEEGTLGILHKNMCDVGCNTTWFSTACKRMTFSDH